MRRAGLYARVSSGKQKDNTSHERQLENCRTYCLQKGYEVVAERLEVASGVLVFARPKFRDLLEMAERGELDVIVCDIPDRLGRGDAIAQLEMFAKLSGVSVEYAEVNSDPESLEGIITDASKGMLSRIERFNIRRRTMGGKRKRVEQGLVMASHMRPYGYFYHVERDDRARIMKSDLIINEDEAKIVRLIFSLCTHEFMSTRGITRYLVQNRILPPRKGRKETREGIWHWEPTTVKNILRNETYAGVWRYGKGSYRYEELPNGKKVRRKVSQNRPDAIAVPVCPIITREQWEQAQFQLEQNRKKFVKPTKYKYLLRGRIRCAKCKSAMHGEFRIIRKRLSFWYRCNRNGQMYSYSRCHAKRVKLDRIEPAVKDIIREAMTSEARLFAGVNKLREEGAKERQALEALLLSCESGIEREREKIDRYQDLYANREMNLDEYRAKCSKVREGISRREKEREELMVRLGKCQILDPVQEQELRDIRAEIEKRMDWGNTEQWMKLLEMLRVEVIYDPDNDEVTVSGIVKGKRTLSNTSR